MNSATYILAYRDGAERRANLDTLLAWLAPQTRIELIVVEQDATPTLPNELPHPRCRVVFAHNPGPFNKGWGFNIGLRLAHTAWIGFGDADLIPGEPLWNAFMQLRDADAVKPYRRLIDLDAEETRDLRSGNFDAIPQRDPGAAPNREGIGEHIVFAGGSFAIRRDAFAALGSWDERFRGWGGEDDAMTLRLRRSGLKCIELDAAPALHLWHPRPRENTFDQPHYADNLRLLDDYENYADAQLQRLAEVQRQLIGRVDKYRNVA
jgi:predicted glycosyltransferase involved in capsule biosynthesis